MKTIIDHGQGIHILSSHQVTWSMIQYFCFKIRYRDYSNLSLAIYIHILVITIWVIPFVHEHLTITNTTKYLFKISEPSSSVYQNKSWRNVLSVLHA